MPIIVEAARRNGRPPILVGLPVLAGLSVTHGLLPPHPSALLATTQYHADVGRTILWGLVVGVPAAALAGPVLGWVLIRRWKRQQLKLAPIPAVANPAPQSAEDNRASDGAVAPAESNPEAGRSPVPAGVVRALVAILLPIALIFVGSWTDAVTAPGSLANQLLHLAGYPDVAMLIAALAALVSLGGHIQAGPAGSDRPHGPDMLRRLTADSFVPIAGVLVILSAAGGLSGVLRDSGAAQATVGLALGAHMPPLVLAWVLAAVVRVCMGSSTVAMAVASGVLAPVAGHMGVRPEMLVLATGSGSLLLSHVNDSGFWLVNSLFKQEVKGTLATWSVLETVLSVTGLGATLLLAALLQ
jgi:GntP family gluconate:H+ symporter